MLSRNRLKSRKQANSRSRDFEAGDKNSRENAVKYALSLLGYRDRSEREIIDKLGRKGFPEKIAKETAAYLKERGFIDDRKFADILKRDAIERKLLGKRGVEYYLAKKGIPSEIAEDVSGSDEDYLDVARKAIAKKLRTMKDGDEKIIKRKLFGMLSRKGFSYDTIYGAIKTLNLKEDQDEDI
jgi:regulatory protein